jgi:hypothetical protein
LQITHVYCIIIQIAARVKKPSPTFRLSSSITLFVWKPFVSLPWVTSPTVDAYSSNKPFEHSIIAITVNAYGTRAISVSRASHAPSKCEHPQLSRHVPISSKSEWCSLEKLSIQYCEQPHQYSSHERFSYCIIIQQQPHVLTAFSKYYSK